MSQQKKRKQEAVRLGTHGEDYGSWMSTPVFFMAGIPAALAILLAVLSFAAFRTPALGILFSGVTICLIALLCWLVWIRRQYAFEGGGVMGRVHQTVLSHLDYDGRGTLLDVGCGSGALSIRAALTWPEGRVVGIDSWQAVYRYSRTLCEKMPPRKERGTGAIFSMATPES